MSSSGGSSLRPAWSKEPGDGTGRGFQPPPTVPSHRTEKARSSSWGSQERRGANKFSALQDDEDGGAYTVDKSDEIAGGNSRSEAFRSSFSRTSSSANKAQGRSLADLAARVPDNAATGRRTNYEARGTGSGRFTGLKTGDQVASSAGGSNDTFKPDPKVIRYTREKLLSMRPPTELSMQALPSTLNHFEGSSILSETPQDPVCWDNLDAEEIWETVREKRPSSTVKSTVGSSRALTESAEEARRRNAPSSGRWQRGVALPPAEEGSRRKGKDADNPNELWDDPIGGAIGAASDFSAFGSMPDDSNGDAFDFNKMAEASMKLEEELSKSQSADEGDDGRHSIKIDPSRPLASAGMTLSSGSGDDVNVFEDFDSPGEEVDNSPSIRGGDEDPSASSRLMKMIGVKRESDEKDAQQSVVNLWDSGSGDPQDPASTTLLSIGGGISIPLNPWGSALSSEVLPNARNGLEMTARLEAIASEQPTTGTDQAKKIEILRLQQEEDLQRRAQAELQIQQQARQQHARAPLMQQGSSQQSQIELVLMERICSFLENSWGRSDLLSILTTLHSEDSRVIPLLSTVDALRALISRSPHRVALRRDASYAAEIAVLLLTNAQWQQQQVQVRMQQEEMRRRQIEEEESAARERARRMASVRHNEPWFYSDPQQNIQGPFRGEEMRQWLEAGYFKGDLPISQQSSGPFVPLSTVFPDLSVAFRSLVPVANRNQESPSSAEAVLLEKMEEDEHRAESGAQQKVRREPNTEPVDKSQSDTEPVLGSTEATGANESSAQLKMMLGLSTAASSVSQQPAESLENPRPLMSDKSVEKSSKKAAPKQPEETPRTVKMSPAWGGAANTKPTKTMSEIQQEEARAAALIAAQGGNISRQSSSGWANVAASGKSGWSSGTLRDTVAPAAASNREQQGQNKASSPTQSTVVRQASPNLQQSSSSTPAEEFGTSMSPLMEKWCKEQMQRINGSDDLTLVAFCLTLDDASEIRQYLTTYLGTTSEVNTFATEFINKRGLGSKQDEWETPGSAKKGRKKKGAGR